MGGWHCGGLLMWHLNPVSVEEVEWGGGEYLLYTVTMSDIVTIRQCDMSVDVSHRCHYSVPSFTCWEPVTWH